MALLQIDTTVEVFMGDGVEPVRERVQAVEFVVHNTKKSMTWIPTLSTCELTEMKEEDLTFGDVTEKERAIGPSLSFYAPLGGQFSKEFRALLRRGLVRMFTQLALQYLHSADDKNIILETKRQGNNTEHGADVAVSFLYIEQRTSNTKVACVHWSFQLLQFLLQRRTSNMTYFTARLPKAATLIPIVNSFKALSLAHRVGSVDEAHAHTTFRLMFTIDRIELVQQSIHDERTADQLAFYLYQFHLKPAEQMRESGGESLQAPLLNLCAALDCYHDALALAQKGLLYPYSHALRPPPSLEDRLENTADDDINDEGFTFVGETELGVGHDITSANRYLNVLLCLKRGTEDGLKIKALYNDRLLENGRSVFPDAHVLLHVWYALHRQVVVAAANAAHTVLLIQPSLVDISSKGAGYSAKELQIQQTKVARWCVRALGLLHRLRVWLNGVTREQLDFTREWIWLHTIKFKLFLRQAKLLRVTGYLDDSHNVQLQAEEQLRMLSAQRQTLTLCRDEIDSVLQEVGNQLARERSLLCEERKQKGGVVLRF